MTYPTKIRVNGEIYPINSDFNTALECMEVSLDPNIDDVERALAIVFLLFGFVPELAIIQKFVDAAVLFLQRGKKQAIHGTRDFDYKQDYGYIQASFMSDYQIDISSEKMHWWRFYDLLSGLTEGASFNRVRELRNYDLSAISDEKTRRRIEQAKKQVALDVRRTDEQQDMIDEFEKELGVK